MRLRQQAFGLELGGKEMAQKLRITLVRSLIGRPEDQRGTVKALGLNKMHKTVEHNDSASIRGMLRKISHMVEVREVN